MRARSGQSVAALLVSGLVVAMLAACSGDDGDGPDPDDGPTPEATAEALAAGLEAGDLLRVAFDPETAAGAQAA